LLRIIELYVAGDSQICFETHISFFVGLGAESRENSLTISLRLIFCFAEIQRGVLALLSECAGPTIGSGNFDHFEMYRSDRLLTE
jgi:hypothetical protein